MNFRISRSALIKTKYSRNVKWFVEPEGLFTLDEINIFISEEDADYFNRTDSIRLIVKMASMADAIFLCICGPDESEAIIGDLIEDYGKVISRRSDYYANFWFLKEVFFITISKTKTRLVKSFIPKFVMDAVIKRLGG